MTRRESRPPAGVLPGEWDPPTIALDPPARVQRQDIHPHAALLHGVLSDADCQRLIDAMIAAGGDEVSSISGSGGLCGNESAPG